ncbi:hypothetical protein A3A66_01650 [Microgenomates group bacterium RIFCSPLOWO2_01_FULL_46_13]|nr:MAG: hypothetical protein A2783_00750 [Microgenomates group bacterium RIFCSPHIGHO2_01_FULL_45_11]OGV94700.1 MAG: hypothetical protein A3A66_01650 [Microgenomates group bacterium RIFCSPLOWO2_01_FULL_46_13]
MADEEKNNGLESLLQIAGGMAVIRQQNEAIEAVASELQRLLAEGHQAGLNTPEGEALIPQVVAKFDQLLEMYAEGVFTIASVRDLAPPPSSEI